MTRSLVFKVHGMDCAEEVAVLKRALGPLVGGEDHLRFDLLNGRLFVSGANPSSSEVILQAIAQTGMKAEPWSESAQGDGHGRPLALRARTLATLASAVIILIALATHAMDGAGILGALGWREAEGAHHLPVAVKALYATASVLAAWFILPKAWYSARTLRPDMNLLMTIAVVGGIAIGEWFEAATVAFLFSVSLTLENWSLGRARRAVQALLKLTPDTVHVLASCGCSCGEVKDTNPGEVTVGTRIQIRPGERIPLDGSIVEGESEVNEAPITGESMPVLKGPGAAVYAGAINGNATLMVATTHTATDTVLARIIRMVGEAQGRRAVAEQWVDRFARVYTPIVMILALLVAVMPPLLGLGAWSPWLYRALVLLVIACPCALVISTPVSIVSGLAAAARHGVLIKGGAYLEAPAHLSAIAFDKTGTLTEGKPEVTQVVALDGYSEREVLQFAGALESQSDHPLAVAISSHTFKGGARALRVEGFEIIPGKGASGRVQERICWLGSHRMVSEKGMEIERVADATAAYARAGRTLVYVGNETEVMGLIILQDALRASAAEVIQDIRRAGIENIAMLTGDNRSTAQAIASAVGVDDCRAELLPASKVEAIADLLARHGSVAMVGDGVNDAPAMARATMGIAMGAAGSDAAIETADVALMSDDLSKIPWLIRHSRRCLFVVKQNIAFALLVKAAFVVLTLSGHASMWAAIAADMGASLLVVFNGLRLLRVGGKD